METLVLILAIPVIIGLIAKIFYNHTIKIQETAIQIFGVVIICLVLWAAGTMSKTADVEIRNGSIIEKTVKTGQYVESYDCRCRTRCSGSGDNRHCRRVCDTCYRDHYTKTWSGNTTVGSFTFQHIDRLSKSAWREPDPQAYTDCKEGEPASLEFMYENYVKAVPESLFNTKLKEETYLAPAYPRVHSHYKVNRVIATDEKVTVDTNELNDLLNRSLIELGNKKQVNLVVVLTSINDPAYKFAVENQWLGGKKNDVVVFIGLMDNKLLWADVMTWANNSGNELFTVKTGDLLRKMVDYNPQEINKVLATSVETMYNRPEMKDYEYLKDAIQPPTWVIILMVIVGVVASLIITVIFHRNQY